MAPILDTFFTLDPASQNEPEVASHFRRNFLVNAGDSMAWLFGEGFHSIATIIPVYVSTLTNSSIVIGLIPALTQAGIVLPQLFMAPYVERATKKMPLVRFMGVMERLPFLGMALAVVWLSRLPESIAVIIFLILIAWRGFSNGLMALPWQVLIATVLPSSHRGRFFGFTYFAGQFLGIGGAVLAAWLLASLEYPMSYAIIFGIGFLSTVISWIFLSQTVEPENAVDIQCEPVVLSHQAARICQLLAADRNFKTFLVSRGLSYAGTMAFGFVTVYGMEQFHLPDAQVGVFTAVLFASSAFGNILWGMIGDRYGHILVLILAGLSWMVGLVVLFVASNVYLFTVVFVFMGLSVTGNTVADLSAAMEFGSKVNRPMYIGMARTLPGILQVTAPIMGGLLVEYASFHMLIGLSMLFTLGSLVAMKVFVRDPHHQALHHTF